MPKLAMQLATTASIFGAQRSILLAVMPTVSKEDSEEDPFDDEIAIKKAFAGAGFNHQQQIRMNLEWPTSVESQVSTGDWWVDLRAMFYGEEKAVLGKVDEEEAAAAGSQRGNFFRLGSELCRTRHVPSVSKVVEVKDLVEPPVDGPPRQEKKYDRADRAAQRGPEFTQNILLALLQKASALRSSNEEWFSPHDETILLDPYPFVGDRALAAMGLNQKCGTPDF